MALFSREPSVRAGLAIVILMTGSSYSCTQHAPEREAPAAATSAADSRPKSEPARAPAPTTAVPTPNGTRAFADLEAQVA